VTFPGESFPNVKCDTLRCKCTRVLKRGRDENYSLYIGRGGLRLYEAPGCTLERGSFYKTVFKRAKTLNKRTAVGYYLYCWNK